jgi:TolB-like protein
MIQNKHVSRLRAGLLSWAIVCLLLLGLPGSAYGQNRGVTLDQAIADSAKHLFEGLPEGSKIAIYDFDFKNINAKPSLNDRIIDDLTTLFSNEARFTLVSRQDLDVVRKEMGFQLSGEVSDDEIKSLGKKLGADFVITGSVSRVYRGYRLYVKPVAVETAAVFPAANPTVRENDPDFRTYLVTESDKKPFRVTAGARAGVSSRLWTLSNDIKGDAESPAAGFEPVVQGAFYFTDLFALQTELAVLRDTVSYSGSDANGAAYDASFQSYSLRVPLLARFTFRPGGFSVSAFGGIAFNIPLGAMKLSGSLYDDSSYRFSTPPGYVIGVNAGVRLGPGALFADIRFSGDFAKTAIHDNSGTLALYTRNTWSFSLGYEWEIFNK